MATNREVRNALEGIADKVICKKDETFEARRMYFYRHGMTVEKFTADVMAAMVGKIHRDHGNHRRKGSLGAMAARFVFLRHLQIHSRRPADTGHFALLREEASMNRKTQGISDARKVCTRGGERCDVAEALVYDWYWHGEGRRKAARHEAKKAPTCMRKTFCESLP